MISNQGVEERVLLQGQMEDRIEAIADMLAGTVVNNIIDNTVGNVKEKQHAVRHLFTEPFISDTDTSQSTPANVLIQ